MNGCLSPLPHCHHLHIPTAFVIRFVLLVVNILVVFVCFIRLVVFVFFIRFVLLVVSPAALKFSY